MATVMAFGAHPDDIEFSCSGTLIKLKHQGHRIICCDLTRSELSTRGTLETRAKEIALASEIMGIDCRENLEIEDGNIDLTKENKLKVINVVRKHRPDVVLAQYYEDRHPDHINASKLVYEASFLSGLARIETDYANFRPSKFIYYTGSWVDLRVSFICDVTEQFEQKMKAIKAYSSQISYDDKNFPETYLTSEAYEWRIKSRQEYYGSLIGKRYGEPFIIREYIEVDDLTELKLKSF